MSENSVDDVLASEAEFVEVRTAMTARTHFMAASFWGRAQLGLGSLAAVLSAIAGASALSDLSNSNVVAGVLALAVTTLTAVTTFLNPSERADGHTRAGNAYLALENRARLFHRLELRSGKAEKELGRQLIRLVGDLNDLNRSSPQAPNRMFRKASKAAKKVERQPTTVERLARKPESPSLPPEPPHQSNGEQSARVVPKKGEQPLAF
jgi:hypothetical protein